MSRRLIGSLIAGSLTWAVAYGGILPDQLGKDKRGAINVETVTDPVLQEYGFDTGESASFGKLSITAWRFRDSTGAMSAFEYTRPADAKPSKQDKLAASGGGITFALHGNYLFQFAGGEPTDQQYDQLLYHIPRIEQSALPAISMALPAEGLIPNSERYILGPVSLEKFLPGVSPSSIAFHLSAEGQYGRYKARDGREMPVVVLSYPTPNQARERADELQKLAGVVVKRTGSLVVMAVNPPSADDAERVLAKIKQELQLTWNENPNSNIALSTAQMLMGIFKLAGIIITFCLLSGLAFAGFRVARRRFGKEDAQGAMITLHLEGK